MDKPTEGTLTLTINETASELRVSRATVYRLIAEEKLRPIRIGSHPRIRRDDLEQYVSGLAA